MKSQVDLFSFVFWRKLKTQKRHFEINWPLAFRVIIKILKNPCYTLNVDWFSLGWSKIKFCFLKKKSKMADYKKVIFQLHQFSIFFMKISWMCYWVSINNWCKGHWCGSTYMIVRLSEIPSKIGKKCIFCNLGWFDNIDCLSSFTNKK